MGNSILGNGGGSSAPQQNNIIQQLMQFRRQFSGNPQQEVMRMLQQGKITQSQIDNAMGVARQIEQMLPKG